MVNVFKVFSGIVALKHTHAFASNKFWLIFFYFIASSWSEKKNKSNCYHGKNLKEKMFHTEQ